MAVDNEKIVVAEFSDHELFTPIYHSFLRSKKLNGKEKLLYIVLKSFLDVGKREGKVFPTIETICDMVDMSKPTVVNILKSLKKKGVLKIEQRGLNKSNVYTLYDYKALWKNNKNEEDSELEKQRKEQEAIDFLKSRGYQFISKEKEPASARRQATDTSTDKSNLHNDTTDKSESQERYPMSDLKDFFEYDALIDRYPEKKVDIDIIFDLLYDTVNTKKSTIRVNGEDKERNVVIGKLMKLQFQDLIYAIDKYHEQTGRIRNVKAYLLTILYHAREQSHLDMMNLGHHNGDF